MWIFPNLKLGVKKLRQGNRLLIKKLRGNPMHPVNQTTTEVQKLKGQSGHTIDTCLQSQSTMRKQSSRSSGGSTDEKPQTTWRTWKTWTWRTWTTCPWRSRKRTSSALWARCQGEPIIDGANTLYALRAQHRRLDSGPRSVDNGAPEDRGRGLTSLPALLFCGSKALTKDFDA